MTIAVSASGTRIDYQSVLKDNNGTYLYTGFADSGTDQASPKWLISRKTLADGTTLWTTGYSATWTGRASATYA